MYIELSENDSMRHKGIFFTLLQFFTCESLNVLDLSKFQIVRNEGFPIYFPNMTEMSTAFSRDKSNTQSTQFNKISHPLLMKPITFQAIIEYITFTTRVI